MSDRPLRIGVVPCLDGSGGGIYQYSTTMLDGLLEIEPRPELILFADPPSGSVPEMWRSRGYRVVPLPPHTGRRRLRMALGHIVGSGRAGRLASRVKRGLGRGRESFDPEYPVKGNPKLGEWIAGSGVDFLVFPAPQTIAFESGLPYVMAVHDLQHRLQPEFPEVSAGGEWDRREYLFRNGVERALTVLVDSEVGREDVLECYGDLVSPDRVAVLPFLPAPYLDVAGAPSRVLAVRDRLAIPERYLFFPAQFWPHKNHLRVVRALAQIRAERGMDVHVVMCGSAPDRLRTSVLKTVRQTARDQGVSDLIHILGYVEDDEMASLYAGARGVLLPTFFGPTNIPILEAWAFGVPVLTSDLRGIREQCGDAAVLVDPTSVGAIAEGIHSLWSDEPRRRRLVSAGTKRLARYGRDDYIARLSEIIRDAGRRARHGGSSRAIGEERTTSSGGKAESQ